MKYLIPLLFVAIAACGPEIEAQPNKLGCLTGIRTPGVDSLGNQLPRELIKCTYSDDAFKGVNWMEDGWMDYNFTPVDSCEQCQ
jgi:hypothetical protein